VELDAGDQAKARYCFEQALAAAPRSPVMLFRAANFDWQTGDSTGVLKKLFRVLSDPQLADLYDPAFLTYSRLSVPLDTILAMGIPEQTLPAARFMRFELMHNNFDAAKRVWQWMLAHRMPTDDTANEYCTFLLQKYPEQAAEAWRSYAIGDPAYRRTNWIFNGSFETPFRPSPFDWHADSTPDVTAERAEDAARTGMHALRLRFLGRENASFQQAYQYAAVPAGQWRLTAHIKTDAVTTEEGIRLHVFDYYANSTLDVWSDMVAGSTDWRMVDVVFHSGPGTRLLRVEPARQASLLFNDHVRGTAWVDSVTLTPEPATARAAH